MVDRSEIREEILGRIGSIDVDLELESRLDSLTLFNENNQLDMKTFYSKFSNIISSSEINIILFRNDVGSHLEAFQKIISILAWAKARWTEFVIKGNLDKAIVCFILLDKLFLIPDKDFTWNINFSNLCEKLKATLPTLKYEVSDELPVFASYADKKFLADYRKSIDTNNYRGIFIFFDAIERGVGFHLEEDEFIKALFRICSLVKIELLSKNIGKYSPPLILLTCETLSKSKLLELIEGYIDENILPLLIAARILFRKERTEETVIDWEYIKKCCIILEKIEERISSDSLYKFIFNNVGNIRSKVWHLTFTLFIAKNEKYINEYSDNIQFRYDEYGQDSFDALLLYGEGKILDEFSKRIYSKFILFVKNLGFSKHPFHYSSYFKYILHAISVDCDQDYKNYILELENVSISLIRCLYSWNLKEKNLYFTKWIYWILAAKNFKNIEEKNISKLKFTYKLLNDPKVMNLLLVKNEELNLDFHELKMFVDDSEKVNQITLPANDEFVKITWN